MPWHRLKTYKTKKTINFIFSFFGIYTPWRIYATRCIECIYSFPIAILFNIKLNGSLNGSKEKLNIFQGSILGLTAQRTAHTEYSTVNCTQKEGHRVLSFCVLFSCCISVNCILSQCNDCSVFQNMI